MKSYTCTYTTVLLIYDSFVDLLYNDFHVEMTINSPSDNTSFHTAGSLESSITEVDLSDVEDQVSQEGNGCLLYWTVTVRPLSLRSQD